MGGAWQTPNPPNASPPFSAYIFNSRIGNVPQTAAIQTVQIFHFILLLSLVNGKAREKLEVLVVASALNYM